MAVTQSVQDGEWHRRHETGELDSYHPKVVKYSDISWNCTSVLVQILGTILMITMTRKTSNFTPS